MSLPRDSPLDEVPTRATEVVAPQSHALDNVVTIPVSLLGRTVGFLNPEQEKLLARSIVLAYDLEIALLDT